MRKSNIFFIWYEACTKHAVFDLHFYLNFASYVDRVFGPTTTTRHVYDVAAQHVVNGAMEGINGMIPSILNVFFIQQDHALAS